MALKDMAKSLIGYIRLRMNKVNASVRSNIYVGKDVSIIGGSKMQVGKNVSIHPCADLWCGGNHFEIGEGSEIGERSRISIVNSMSMGKKVLLSPNVYITDCDHEYRQVGIPVIDQGTVINNNRVIIEDGVYIGINSVIVGNVTIGRGSVVGANSVVTKSIPDYCVAAGVPEKKIKKYNTQTAAWEKV